MGLIKNVLPFVNRLPAHCHARSKRKPGQKCLNRFGKPPSWPPRPSQFNLHSLVPFIALTKGKEMIQAVCKLRSKLLMLKDVRRYVNYIDQRWRKQCYYCCDKGAYYKKRTHGNKFSYRYKATDLIFVEENAQCAKICISNCVQKFFHYFTGNQN